LQVNGAFYLEKHTRLQESAVRQFSVYRSKPSCAEIVACLKKVGLSVDVAASSHTRLEAADPQIVPACWPPHTSPARSSD